MNDSILLMFLMHCTPNLQCFPDELPSSLDETTGTATNSVYPLFPSDLEERPPKKYPYTFPYFLYPPHKIPVALASHRPYEVYAYNISTHYADTFDELNSEHFLHHHPNKHLHHYSASEHHRIDYNNSNSINQKNNLHHKHSNSTISTFTSYLPSSPPFDHEWRREQYKLARAKIGESSTDA